MSKVKVLLFTNNGKKYFIDVDDEMLNIFRIIQGVVYEFSKNVLQIDDIDLSNIHLHGSTIVNIVSKALNKNIIEFNDFDFYIKPIAEYDKCVHYIDFEEAYYDENGIGHLINKDCEREYHLHKTKQVDINYNKLNKLLNIYKMVDEFKINGYTIKKIYTKTFHYSNLYKYVGKFSVNILGKEYYFDICIIDTITNFSIPITTMSLTYCAKNGYSFYCHQNALKNIYEMFMDISLGPIVLPDSLNDDILYHYKKYIKKGLNFSNLILDEKKEFEGIWCSKKINGTNLSFKIKKEDDECIFIDIENVYICVCFKHFNDIIYSDINEKLKIIYKRGVKMIEIYNMKKKKERYDYSLLISNNLINE